MIGELRKGKAAANEAAPTDPTKTNQAQLLGPMKAKPLCANLPCKLKN